MCTERGGDPIVSELPDIRSGSSPNADVLTPGRRQFPMAILCGGQNSRLGPLSGTIYKPFLPIQGMTTIARNVTRAVLAGIQDITVLMDMEDTLIRSYVEGMSAGLRGRANISILLVEGEHSEKLTSYASRRAARPPVLVSLGDSYSLYDPVLLGQASLQEGIDSAITIAAFRLPFGVVTTSNGRVISFAEKPMTPYFVNLGQLALGERAFDLLAHGHSMASALGVLASEGRLAATEVSSEFVTFDSIADIARAYEGQASHLTRNARWTEPQES
jgi:NDP-sugar pyrophosphorylase family protein